MTQDTRIHTVNVVLIIFKVGVFFLHETCESEQLVI